ncbi:MAG: hypothetical protein N0C90_12915 [Candidatus Thiodiazotropha endolucinida]|nr:hypothetical protein [Candidatus Thiodiazotropha taylori]MCW4262262.1 hypothetical protein [Candidatus Thiodiazotropha endolucinida]
MISRMKQTLSNAWGYRPFRDPLKRFGGEAYDSAENIAWTYSEAYRQAAKTVRIGEIGIRDALKIINSYTDEECRQHFLNKPRAQVIEEYFGHRRTFYLAVLALIYGLIYNFSPVATMHINTLLFGQVVIIASGFVFIPLFGWRCWQARVGGNYPPHRFIAALLRNPLNIFP